MGHREPSPRELAAHKQSMMQNTLIKKQMEDHRKRQEQQHHSMNQRANTPVNSKPPTHSPTPLAFTPTSVLRKMTAEKEPEGQMLTCAQLELAQKSQATIIDELGLKPKHMITSQSCKITIKEIDKSIPDVAELIEQIGNRNSNKCVKNASREKKENNVAVIEAK